MLVKLDLRGVLTFIYQTSLSPILWMKIQADPCYFTDHLGKKKSYNHVYAYGL